jgi:ribonuclease R
MKYYNNYIENTELLTDYGILSKDDRNHFIVITLSYGDEVGITRGIMECNGIITKQTKENSTTFIIENNRGIIGDSVYFHENKVINIKERSKQHIVGILDVESKVKYGMFKDKPLHLFKPTNKKYDNFHVPYRNEKKDTINQNIYCIIEFKQWEPTNKYPLGTLIETIGPIGNNDAEFDHLRNYYSLRKNTWKVDKKRADEDVLKIERLQLEKYDYSVFSIDPLGSKDIDDAFHFTVKDNYYEVGIHIANPLVFFKNDLIHILEERISTVYSPYRKFNMLPNIYADSLCSLLENTRRYALSVVFKITMGKGEKYYIIDSEIKETVVFIEKNYDYDSFDKVFQKKDGLLEFMNFSKEFFAEDELDSHKLVEEWMIATNKYVANYLIERGEMNTLVRVHRGKVKKDINNFGEGEEQKELHHYLKTIGESSAYYELYNGGIETEEKGSQTHDKMDNSYYTHFTSPIRRGVDIFIHSLLIEKESNSNNEYRSKLCEIIEKVNHFVRCARKFDRMCKRLDFLNKIKDETCITYAYIIKISTNKLTLYLPEYKLEEKMWIVPRKFKGLYELEYEFDTILTESIQSVSYKKEENEKVEYSLYQKLTIQLWVFLKEENIFDKLIIEKI